MSDDEASAGCSSPPVLPPESPGSSVSTRMQEEYSELLKFALASNPQDPQAEDDGEVAAPESGGILDPLSLVVGAAATSLAEEEESEHPLLQTEASADLQNTNSNNIYHDTSNESPVVCQEEADTNNSHQADANSSHGQEELPSASKGIICPDVTEMGCKLDCWLGKLKCDILGELSRTVVKAMENQRCEHEQSVQDLVCDKQKLQRDSTRLSEQIVGLEQSLCRKDTLVENLTQALAASKEKVTVARSFYDVRASASDEKRLSFTEKLAVRHHEQHLIKRVFGAWFGLIQTRWKTRVSKSVEEHAFNVCAKLSQDYEDKIKNLNNTIACLEQKVCFLQQERGQYAEQVRKAFMRGVCALNMETMSAFGPEENLDLDPVTGHSKPRTVLTGPASYQEDGLDYSHNANTQTFSQPLSATVVLEGAAPQSQPQSVPSPVGDREQSKGGHSQRQQPQQYHQLSSMPTAEVSYHSGVIESGTVGLQTRSVPISATHKAKSKIAKTKGKPTSSSSAPTRPSVRSGGVANQGQALAPPMASVVVERHNPVTKQTLGKATAVRFPKSTPGHVSKSSPSSVMGQTFKPLAGQSSVKVVD